MKPELCQKCWNSGQVPGGENQPVFMPCSCQFTRETRAPEFTGSPTEIAWKYVQKGLQATNRSEMRIALAAMSAKAQPRMGIKRKV